MSVTDPSEGLKKPVGDLDKKRFQQKRPTAGSIVKKFPGVGGRTLIDSYGKDLRLGLGSM